MTLIATAGAALSDADRQSLLRVLISKMDQACFIDWVVGVVALAFYSVILYNTPLENLDAASLWPLVAMLLATRAGNTIVRAVSDWSYWRYHKPGEQQDDNNGGY